MELLRLATMRNSILPKIPPNIRMELFQWFVMVLPWFGKVWEMPMTQKAYIEAHKPMLVSSDFYKYRNDRFENDLP